MISLLSDVEVRVFVHLIGIGCGRMTADINFSSIFSVRKGWESQMVSGIGHLIVIPTMVCSIPSIVKLNFNSWTFWKYCIALSEDTVTTLMVFKTA